MKQKVLVLVATLLAAGSALPARAAAPPAIVAPASAAVAPVPAYARHASTIKDEHLVPPPAGVRSAKVSTQLPTSLAFPKVGARIAQAAASANSPNGFLTIPFLSWKSINSVFDHCNPDYTLDNWVCRFDGVNGYKGNGVDPGFSRGYATNPDAGSLWLTGGPQYPLPDEATGATAVAGNGSALVTWQAPAFTGGLPITNYTVTASPGGASVSVPGSQTSATVPGLTNGVSYTFRVSDANAVGAGPNSGASNAVLPGTAPTFYFSEGYTGTGFTETLTLVMPGQAGNATIDYYTENGHLPTSTIALSAGVAQVINVNAAVGPNHMVSAKVSLPGPGVAERAMHFNTGTWHGSSNLVGATKTSTEWDFAEGSTLSAFSEYLSLQNPNDAAVTVDLNYMTDINAHPTKTLVVPAGSRLTVDVARGDLSNSPSCVPSGTGASCGVGAGITGVSVQVKSRSQPIVAERPFYVNGYNFGSGPIRDGHDAFGATAPATLWYFAEGTTQNGFNEYLSLQNPGSTPASVTLTYLNPLGNATTKTLTIRAASRTTVLVAAPVNGAGPGLPGVSGTVSPSQPIGAERPMYMVANFPG